MKYDQLVYWIHLQTWVEPDKIKQVLESLADVLRTRHEVGEQTRTPLGVFSTHVRERKNWVLPDGRPTQIPERIQIQLNPSARMTRGWTPQKRAHLDKLIKKNHKPVWNPKKVLLDEDDEDLEYDERLEED